MGLVQALGMEDSCVPRIATGFGGGMGRCGETCGAVSGAVMALGLRFGRASEEDKDARGRVYPLVERLLRAFRAEYGSVRCTDLLGCDLGTPEGQAKMHSGDLAKAICIPAVRFAAREAEKLKGM